MGTFLSSFDILKTIYLTAGKNPQTMKRRKISCFLPNAKQDGIFGGFTSLPIARLHLHSKREPLEMTQTLKQRPLTFVFACCRFKRNKNSRLRLCINAWTALTL